MSRAQLVEVVERPGALVSLGFEPGVVDSIVSETGTDDALPLLAYLLQELYFASGPGGTVTEELYRRLGGVPGALARQADNTVTELGAGVGIDAVLRVLLRFVTVEGRRWPAVMCRCPNSANGTAMSSMPSSRHGCCALTSRATAP